MRSRQPLPQRWLMTDERMGEALWRALERLPRGNGVVFRHHATAPAERRRLFQRVRRVTRRRRLLLILASDGRAAVRWDANGIHGRRGRRADPRWILTAPVHDAAEARAARRAGADLVFVSPVFPTRSHPGARVLGRIGFARLAASARAKVIALGGMDERRFRALRPLGAHGWAAIDAWL